MNAVTFPEPLAEAPAAAVTPLPEPSRSRRGLAAAFGVVAVLIAATVGYLVWPDTTSATPELLVTGTAEQVVTAHLHGDRAALGALVAVEIPESLATGHYYVRSATAISVQKTDTGWDVVVAADRLRAVPGGFGDPRIEHFLVVFHDRPTGAVVVALPALVPAPDPPSVRAAAWPAPPSDEMTAAVDHYVRWLLIGDDGPFDGTPVSPPPFTAVAITGMQRSEQADGVNVLVAVEAIRPDGSVMPLHYALDLEAAESGWKVSRTGS